MIGSFSGIDSSISINLTILIIKMMQVCHSCIHHPIGGFQMLFHPQEMRPCPIYTVRLGIFSD
jgi:hypothetical protein